jgi:hypothetical protein
MDGPRSAEDDREDTESWRLALVVLVDALITHELPVAQVRGLLEKVQVGLQRDAGCNGVLHKDGGTYALSLAMVRGLQTTVDWRSSGGSATSPATISRSTATSPTTSYRPRQISMTLGAGALATCTPSPPRAASGSCARSRCDGSERGVLDFFNDRAGYRSVRR